MFWPKIDKSKNPVTKRIVYHVLRIFNKRRTRLIMCQFDNGVWTLPLVTIKSKETAHQELLDYMNTHFPGVLTVVSIVNVAEWVDVLPRITRPAENNEITTFLYDVEVEGDIEPAVFGGYSTVRWTVPEYITSAQQVNRPTLATRQLMEKEDG